MVLFFRKKEKAKEQRLIKTYGRKIKRDCYTRGWRHPSSTFSCIFSLAFSLEFAARVILRLASIIHFSSFPIANDHPFPFRITKGLAIGRKLTVLRTRDATHAYAYVTIEKYTTVSYMAFIESVSSRTQKRLVHRIKRKMATDSRSVDGYEHSLI